MRGYEGPSRLKGSLVAMGLSRNDLKSSHIDEGKEQPKSPCRGDCKVQPSSNMEHIDSGRMVNN